MTERDLDRESLPVDTQSLARALIGMQVVRIHDGVRASGRIVETEAYVLRDPASHAFRGERARTATMFGAPFHAYVYRIYGLHWCFNVSSEERGHGAAVLIRALEPLEGIGLMQARRRCGDPRLLCRGPARLCEALQIDRSLDGRNLLTDPVIRLERGADAPVTVRRSRRIGVTQASQRLLRFYEPGNPFVSGPRSLSP